MNPRPKKPAMQDYVRIRFGIFRPPTVRTGKSERLSPIDLGLPAPDRSLEPILQNDAHSPPCRLSGWSGYLIN